MLSSQVQQFQQLTKEDVPLNVSSVQAESELKANKGVIRDSQLAKYREALLSMSILEPGLVLQSVPKGHSASAKVSYLIACQRFKPVAECLSACNMTTEKQRTTACVA